MQKLICISGINVGEEFELKEGEISLGRSMDNDICIVDTQSSRYHCKIYCNESHLTVEDLNSTNGLFLNNLRVAGKIEMSVGDLITIGNTTYQLYDCNNCPTDLDTTAKALLNSNTKISEDLLRQTTLQITKTSTIPKATREQLQSGDTLKFFRDR